MNQGDNLGRVTDARQILCELELCPTQLPNLRRVLVSLQKCDAESASGEALGDFPGKTRCVRTGMDGNCDIASVCRTRGNAPTEAQEGTALAVREFKFRKSLVYDRINGGSTIGTHREGPACPPVHCRP